MATSGVSALNPPKEERHGRPHPCQRRQATQPLHPERWKALVDATIECMCRSEVEDPFLLGKAEGLHMAISHESGASLGWVRDYICEESF